jgi:hypothetical protein
MFVDVGALSDESTGLSFTIAAGPRQRSNLESKSRETRDHILLSQIRGYHCQQRNPGNVFTKPLCSNALFRLSGVMSQYKRLIEKSLYPSSTSCRTEIIYINSRVVVLIAVTVNITVYWYVTPCSLVDRNRHLGRKYF